MLPAATIVLAQSGDLTVSVNGGIAASTVQAAGTIDASGATITADAVTGHKGITLSGTTTVNSQVLSGGNVSISGPSIKAGAIVAGVDFAGTAAANGSIVLASSGDLDACLRRQSQRQHAAVRRQPQCYWRNSCRRYSHGPWRSDA